MSKKSTPSTFSIKGIGRVTNPFIDVTCPVCKRKFRLKAGRVVFCPWGCIVAGFEVTPMPTVNTDIPAGGTDVNT